MVTHEWMGMPPTVSLSPPINWQREDPHWRHFDNSVTAVSFGFVAAAILISMFLVMAVFERFVRPPPPSKTFVARGASRHRHPMDSTARAGLDWKLGAAPPPPILLSQHLFYWKNPKEQKAILIIILMAPIYAIDSFVGLLDFRGSKTFFMFLDSIKECYVAFVIAKFMALVLF